VALHKRYYRLYKKSIGKYDLQKHLTKIKGRFKGEWKRLGSQAIQDVTDRLDKAYKLFFGNLKRKVRTSPPSFKSRYKYKSFTLKQAGYKLNQEENEIVINKHKYKYFNSRCFDGDIKTLTVKRNHKGELFIIFSVEQEMKLKVGFKTGKEAGFDFGLTTFLVDSDGKKFISPQYLSESYQKLRVLGNRLSKKKKGSNNRQKAKLQLISLHERIVNQRDDWQWKTALDIVRTYDVICLETLSFVKMQKDETLDTKTKKKNRARKMLDLSPGSFIEKLKYKAVEYGKETRFVGKYFPSTRMCSNCSHVMGKMSTEIREWTCPICGTHHDRDQNAAINIYAEGTSSVGIGGVRLEHSNVLELLPF
jgi:putative transposase